MARSSSWVVFVLVAVVTGGGCQPKHSGGGGTSTGGSGGAGGASGRGGSDGGGGALGASDAGRQADSGGTAGAWPNCLEPVFPGTTPAEFCTVYSRVCTFMGPNRYASMPDCLIRFSASDEGDACKAGHLCRAATKPTMKEADCASAGTAACRN